MTRRISNRCDKIARWVLRMEIPGEAEGVEGLDRGYCASIGWSFGAI